MTPIQQLQQRLALPTTGVFDHATGTALWAAWRAGTIAAQDPIVLAARDEACAVYGPFPGPMPTPGTAIMVGGRWRPLSPDVPLWVVPYRMRSLKSVPRRQTVVQVILHHDVEGSARECYDTLKAAGKSTHLCTDDNGIVLQFADPATDVCWHALGHVKDELGKAVSHSFNWRAVGWDLSNPVLPDTRDGKADADRPLVTEKIHKRDLTYLDFYPCQEDATVEGLKALRRQMPTIGASYRVHTEWKGDLTGSTPGMFGHYHVNTGKIDPFGFPMARLAEVG